jgi:predicted CoA-binding protein
VTTKEILEAYRTIAVIGLSSRQTRPSYGVSRYMQANGYRIIPVNPNETEVLEEKSYSHLNEIPEAVEIVNVFRRSELVDEIVGSAIQIGARCIWMQEGVDNEPAAERARDAGLAVVVNRCILKEHLALNR